MERRLGTKKFRKIFKTITCDNGCENLDFNGMEKSVMTNIPRTQVFYAHPTALGSVVPMSVPTSLSDVLSLREAIFQSIPKSL